MTANRYRISSWGDRSVLELDSGDKLHNFVYIVKVTELCTFKRVNFMLCELYLNLRERHIQTEQEE